MLRTTNDNFFLQHNYAIITLYILDRPSSWSTWRICPSWPQSRVRLSLLLSLSHKYSSYLFWPTQYLAICPNGSCFTLNPPSPAGQLNTSIQVNNMAALRHIYTVTHIYITFILLFISFFILLPLLWAGQLLQTFLVCHDSHLVEITAIHILNRTRHSGD